MEWMSAVLRRRSSVGIAAAALLLVPALRAQQTDAPAPASSSASSPETAPAAPQADAPAVVAGRLYANLVGRWVGILEYRDFKSDDRYKLPTWLTVELSADGKSLLFHYTFDDGPLKTLHETNQITIVPATQSWTVVTEGEPNDIYKVEGLDKLKDGRGKLTLLNSGTENRKIVDTKTDVTLGRNLFVMERSTRLPGQNYAFRHIYSFTRANAPDEKALPSAPLPAQK
jgi:hypothetical protein